ncbi:MAG: ParB/RepB/Spo0J family partition protein [Tissierellia bacterium]|nr:ParB/RepB/Spo0J family partition protein [Tissierellia bacterium]
MIKKKKTLGRGIGNFLADSQKIEEILNPKQEDILQEIPLELIDTNIHQPRKDFDKKALEELAESIKIYGIIQPLILRKKEDRYEIIAGERRFRGAKMVGLSQVPAVIKDVDGLLSEKMALIENIQRQDLNPIEEGRSYQSIMKAYGMTQEELAKALGKSRQYIGNTVRLLKLDPRVVDLISAGKITPSHGKVLLGYRDFEKQYQEALKIMKYNQPVADTKVTSTKGKKVVEDIFLKDIKHQLMDVLGTKVEFKGRGKKKKIEIEYYSEDDLSRICNLILERK